MEYELYHHGILGMHWGIRRYQNKDGSLTSEGKKRKYRSTSLRSAFARRENEKVDKSFKRWQEQSKAKENAINAGKKYNEAKISGTVDKKELKSLKKDYKKSLREVSTYRKGQVKQDVGRDLSRKYLTQANRVYKQMEKDPNNSTLQKEYQRLMNLHDKERYSARRASDVGAARSNRIASVKRGLTTGAKTLATSALVGAGLYFTNKYLNSKGVGVKLNSPDVINTINKVRDVLKYVY